MLDTFEEIYALSRWWVDLDRTIPSSTCWYSSSPPLVGYPDTKAHAMNENIWLDLYHNHARHMARMMVMEFGGQ